MTIRALIAALVLAGLPAAALAQATSNVPSDHPGKAVINVLASDPHYTPNGDITLLLQVTSVTGAPLPIAIDNLKSGWTAYGASGANCTAGNILPSNVPTVTNGSLQNNADPTLFTAGVKRAALVPVRVLCPLQRGEEMSFTATFLVLVDGNWIPQQFSWQRVIVK